MRVYLPGRAKTSRKKNEKDESFNPYCLCINLRIKTLLVSHFSHPHPSLIYSFFVVVIWCRPCHNGNFDWFLHLFRVWILPVIKWSAEMHSNIFNFAVRPPGPCKYTESQRERERERVWSNIIQIPESSSLWTQLYAYQLLFCSW